MMRGGSKLLLLFSCCFHVSLADRLRLDFGNALERYLAVSTAPILHLSTLAFRCAGSETIVRAWIGYCGGGLLAPKAVQVVFVEHRIRNNLTRKWS